MSKDEPEREREYVGMIWIADQPGTRLRLMATSLDHARALVIEQYGEGHEISLWNEEDASGAR